MKNYIITDRAVIIEMEKPLFGTKYYIRDKYIDIAKRRKLKLVLKTPDGIATYTPKEWMKGAEKMDKVFLIEDHPMRLWGKHIGSDVFKRLERKELEKQPEITKDDFTRSLEAKLSALKAALHK